MDSAEKKITEAVTQAVEKTFADMAFIDAIRIESGSGMLPKGQLIHIGFAKPVEGHITLYLDAPLKRLITENIFGKTWDATDDDEIDDCLLELLNVLAGNFLKELGESEEQHHISLPQLLYDDETIAALADTQVYNFDAEGHPFGVSVQYSGS
jgi:CheY-specific phosphatase CheX